jgi:uroporphyrin-3 C-methyltransferase
MADSQDKLTPSDEAKLLELGKQLSKEKAASTSEKKEQDTITTSKKADKPVIKASDKSAKETSFKSNKNSATPLSRKPAKNASGKTNLLWFFTFINFLVLVVIMGAAYWAWLQWQAQSQQQTAFLAVQQTSMEQQQTSMLEQQDDITESIASNQLAKGVLEQQNQALQSSIASLIESSRHIGQKAR